MTFLTLFGSNPDKASNPYEDVYATAWPCNSKELPQVPEWPPLPHWELCLGRPPIVKRQNIPVSGILSTSLCGRCRHPGL